MTKKWFVNKMITTWPTEEAEKCPLMNDPAFLPRPRSKEPVSGPMTGKNNRFFLLCHPAIMDVRQSWDPREGERVIGARAVQGRI